MSLVLTDKKAIEAFLRKQTFHHLYEIGDLDDFFWPNTTWYALEKNGFLDSICLLYKSGGGLPVLLAFRDEKCLAAATEDSSNSLNGALLPELLHNLCGVLPGQFYAHLSLGLKNSLEPACRSQFHGRHDKMGLINSRALEPFLSSETFQLQETHLEEIKKLYQESYPGNWFDARMLATGQYVGIRAGGRLASIAGVHVYSQEYRVAALGNITTHPQFRGRGLAAKVVASLCLELLKTVEQIGLNVRSDNKAAIACYQKLGFERITSYEEYVFVRT